MELKPGYKQTEVGVIPEDWVLKPIGDFVSISVGRDLKEKNYSTFKMIFLSIQYSRIQL